MIVQPIDLNMIPDSPPVILHCDQYDEGTGRISAHLYDGDQSYAPTNATVMIQGTKPDGKGFQYAATISGNVVTADLTKQMTAVAGNVRTQIVVTESSGRTGSFAFTLSVQKSALPSDTDMSASDYQIIEELIEDVQEAVGTATQSASDAEAWAVGERGGEPVPPTDPTYQNNAEYWARYAEEHGSVPVMTGSILGIGSPDDLTTIATNGIITAKGVAISATVNPSGTEHGANWLKHGTTVLTPDTEQMYLVYIDNAPTLWTWDGTAYVQISGGGGPTGSTITVTTTETTLFGEDVTLTDGTSTLTETFDNTGTAVFTRVTMTGTLTAESTDGSSTATGTVAVTDPGTYTVQINFWIATINITTDSPDMYGQTITVKNSNNVTVATTTFSNQGTASVTVGSADTYTVSCLTDSDNVTVSAQTTYTVNLHLWTATLSISTSDSSLYGEPIDIQRGGTYVGRTTFSNAGTATYNVHDTGTYYVTCQGNSESVTVSVETTYSVIINISVIYGFHIDGTESDPYARITYLEDAVGMTPAHMNYTTGQFDYGSWENAFFKPRPCMLKSDGTVDYYLDPDDLSKKADGVTASDIANTSYNGNAMMEWGQNGKKIWCKYVPSSDHLSADIYISDHQADVNYHDWPFHNSQSQGMDHFYTSIYNGSLINGKLRSLSGQAVSKNLTAAQQITAAQLNNPSSDIMWNTELFSDIVLINMLLILMAKSTDMQTVYGKGIITGGSGVVNNFRTGVHNSKGMFYGTNSGGDAVKVFGMENWWAFQWRRYQGHVIDNGVQKVKCTYGTEDGSTASSYTVNGEPTGAGYKNTGATPLSGTGGSYIKNMYFTEDGMVPCGALDGSSLTYYCDGCWYNNSGVRVALRGGDPTHGAQEGAFCVNLNDAASVDAWSFGAALSCKPISG